MPYEVLRTATAARVVDEQFDGKHTKKYIAVRDSLRGEGCKAGGKRLMARRGGDYSLCQRSIYAAWRMTLAFRSDGTIIIVQIAEHNESHNPNEVLSEIFNGLSPSGRRRSDQPPCCDDESLPPYLEPELEELLFASLGI